MFLKSFKYLISLMAVLFFVPDNAALAQLNAYNRPYIVVNAITGDVLAEHNSFQPWYPASLTKMMTTYLVFKALAAGQLTKNSLVRLSRYDVSQAPSKSGYRAGTILSLDSALKIMLVKSTNDLATAIGRVVAKTNSNFVTLMNIEAKKLGMKYSHFASANGLPNVNNYSTARDLALLAMALRRDFPQYCYYFNIKALDMGIASQLILNSNNLLGHFKDIDGMKTGFICASGYNLVASANRNGLELIAVVLGAPRLDIREEVAAQLLENGFKNSAKKTVNIYDIQPKYRYAKTPPNLRHEMCSLEAARARKPYLDKYFRPIMHSPYISTASKEFTIVHVKPVYIPATPKQKIQKIIRKSQIKAFALSN